MNEEVKTIRNNIVRKFCRTVLWIDDEIHLDQGLAPKGTPTLFQNKFDEFTRSGLLCHMMGFPATINDSDPYSPQSKVDEVLGSCISLALQSDIVIVDWMLGTTDSSEYAQKIVTGIVGQDKGFRFIVVLSQKTPEDFEFTKIDSSFKCYDASALWKNESGQFLLSLRKDEFNDANLFEKLCSALLDAYPDYLHLAALEIAGRIKDITPRWLSDIPSCTDIGVLVERGNTFDAASWNDEIQECIVTNLLEDLSCAVRVEKLDSLNAEALKPSNCAEYDRIVALNPSGPSDFSQAVNALKECVKDDSPNSFSKGHYEKMSDSRENGDAKILVESIETFAEFCEKRSARDWTGYGPCPGAAYNGLLDSSSSIAICITSGCDCLRADTLLFLIGEPMPSENLSGVTIPDYKELRKMKGRKTVLRINGVSYVFKSSADSVLTKKRSEIETLQVQAIVRQDALNRLIGRYMSHTQRYGVNQPDIVRKLRDEGELD